MKTNYINQLQRDGEADENYSNGFIATKIFTPIVEDNVWDEAKYKVLLDSHNELLNYIKSDSVYNLLRRGVKSPSSTGMDDCNDSNYFDLYTISTNLRNQQS